MLRMVELCHCGHANDHTRKRCSHPIGNDVAQMCPCQNGHRVDVATFRVLTQVGRDLAEMKVTLMRLLAVMETATALQSAIVPNEDGRSSHIEVARTQPEPTLIVPR